MGKQDPFLVERDLERFRKLQPHLFPILETTPDLHRGQIRLAAEVALATIRDTKILPTQVKAFEVARLRTFETLTVLAKG